MGLRLHWGGASQASMQPPRLHRHLSLADLAKKLAPPAPAVSKRDPVDRLAAMLDLRGSVRVSEVAASIDPALVTEGGAPPTLVEEVERGVLAILDEVPKAFTSLRRPARVLRAIRAESEPLASAKALTERFDEAMVRSVLRARGDLRTLRDELGTKLRQAGPRASALERLDAALAEATRVATSARLAALVPLAIEAFERAATEKVVAAGDALDLAKVEGWCRPGGWLFRAVTEGEEAALAVARFEAKPLLALVEAVV